MNTLHTSTHAICQTLAQIFATFDETYSRAPYARGYSIAGCRFDVRSDQEAYLETCDRALAARNAPYDRNCRIVVGVAGENGFPQLRWSAPHFNEREVEALLAPTQYRLHYFHDKGFWQLFDRASSAGLQIMQQPGAAPDWDAGSPLRNLLQWQLAGPQSALLHGGTLGLDGVGILLAGAGGSGKSGTVLSGILDGLESVGDDYVFVKTDEMVAYPLFETLKQEPGGIARLNLTDHPAIPTATNWQGKHQFYLPDLVSHRPDNLSLRALMIPHISGKEHTQIMPASSKDAFLALAPSGVSQIPGDRALLYKVAAQASRLLPTYHLNLGQDPIEVAQKIRNFISRDLA